MAVEEDHKVPQECVSRSEHEKLKQWYHEELLRKDAEIERLRKSNDLLLKSALKQADMKLPPVDRTEDKGLHGKSYETQFKNKVKIDDS